MWCFKPLSLCFSSNRKLILGRCDLQPEYDMNKHCLSRTPSPVFWPGEFHGLYSHRVAKTLTGLSEFHFQAELNCIPDYGVFLY